MPKTFLDPSTPTSTSSLQTPRKSSFLSGRLAFSLVVIALVAILAVVMWKTHSKQDSYDPKDSQPAVVVSNPQAFENIDSLDRRWLSGVADFYRGDQLVASIPPGGAKTIRLGKGATYALEFRGERHTFMLPDYNWPCVIDCSYEVHSWSYHNGSPNLVVDCNLVVRNGGDDYLNFGHYPRDYSVISVNGKAAASVHPVGSKYLVYSQFTEKQHLFILDNFSGKEDDLAVGNRDTMSFSIFPNEYKK